MQVGFLPVLLMVSLTVKKIETEQKRRRERVTVWQKVLHKTVNLERCVKNYLYHYENEAGQK